MPMSTLLNKRHFEKSQRKCFPVCLDLFYVSFHQLQDGNISFFLIIEQFCLCVCFFLNTKSNPVFNISTNLIELICIIKLTSRVFNSFVGSLGCIGRKYNCFISLRKQMAKTLCPEVLVRNRTRMNNFVCISQLIFRSSRDLDILALTPNIMFMPLLKEIFFKQFYLHNVGHVVIPVLKILEHFIHSGVCLKNFKGDGNCFAKFLSRVKTYFLNSYFESLFTIQGYLTFFLHGLPQVRYSSYLQHRASEVCVPNRQMFAKLMKQPLLYFAVKILLWGISVPRVDLNQHDQSTNSFNILLGGPFRWGHKGGYINQHLTARIKSIHFSTLSSKSLNVSHLMDIASLRPMDSGQKNPLLRLNKLVLSFSSYNNFFGNYICIWYPYHLQLLPVPGSPPFPPPLYIISAFYHTALFHPFLNSYRKKLR
uniref:Un1 protein n=1 Tax=Paracentrotus lividus TaxID=7656 RepID=Q8MQH8_PARLI|nr:un1 protein [Paracentrotus lividus]